MRLFRNESGYPRPNAQSNLLGRTHYVDSDTLRFHKSRILSARATDDGLLFAITTSDALDYENKQRGFRYVIFDIFGTVLARPNLAESFRRHEQATKAMWKALNAIDACQHTFDAIDQAEKNHARKMNELRGTVKGLIKSKSAA